MFTVNEKMEGPVFIEPPESLEVLEGTNATFTCKASGKPVPKITWSMQGQQIEEDKFISIKDKQDSKTLVSQSDFKIKKASIEAHEGVYNVEAASEAGRTSYEVQLIGRTYTNI